MVETRQSLNRASSISLSWLGIWIKDRAVSLCFVFVLGMAAYLTLMIHTPFNPDAVTMWNGSYGAGIWELQLGRWALGPLDSLRGALATPAYAIPLSLALYSLMCCVICDCWEIQSQTVRCLVGVLVVLSPYAASTLTYYYCSVDYAFAALCAVCAIKLLMEEGYQRFFFAVGILTISTALYQSSVNLAIVVAMTTVVIRAVNNQENDSITVNYHLALRLIAMLALSVVLYYVLLKLILAYNKLDMASYNGAREAGLSAMLGSLGSTIPQAYVQFARLFAGTSLARNAFHIRLINACIFSLFTFACLWQLILAVKNRLISERDAIGIMLCIAALPLVVNFVGLFATSADLDARTMVAHYLILPFVITMTLSIGMKLGRVVTTPRQSLITQSLLCSSLICAALLALALWTQVNADLAYMTQHQQWMQKLADRVALSAQEAGYQGGSDTRQLIIVGTPDNQFEAELPLVDEVNNFAHYSVFWTGYEGASQGGWRDLMALEQGWKVNEISPAEFKNIAQSPEFQTLPSYPNQAAISEINGQLVVKISDSY